MDSDNAFVAAESHRPKSYPWFPALSLFLGILIGFLLVEYVLWAFRLPDRLKAMPEDFFVGRHFVLKVDNPKIKYRNAPNSVKATVYPSNPRGYFDEKDLPDGRHVCSLEHVNNRYGLRGEDFPLKKPTGTRRIAFLGDSYTYGQGVRLEDTLAQRVCEALTEGGTPTQAINLAVNGHDTSAQVELFLQFGVRFDPDFVVLAYALNDAGQDAHFFKSVDDTRTQAGPGWASRSRLLDLATRLIRLNRESKTYIQTTRAAYLDPDKEGWKRAKAEILRLRDECEKRDLPLLVTVWPFLFRVSEGYPFTEVHETVVGFCEESGIPVLDYLPLFRGKDERRLWVHENDQHPNEAANALLVEALRKSTLESATSRPH